MVKEVFTIRKPQSIQINKHAYSYWSMENVRSRAIMRICWVQEAQIRKLSLHREGNKNKVKRRRDV